MSDAASGFDVFISYKNSDVNGERTRDAQMAFDLHDKLEERGISAFCSTLSLTRMGQGAYKDAINNALDAAKVLVVVGTSLDNILSPWVKYEWGSFHDDLLTGRKSGGTLVSYTSGLDPNELPRELRGYESFLTEQNGDELIVDFIAAALESKIEMGYAGTKLERKLGVIGPATRSLLVNAEDPDPLNGTTTKTAKKRGKGGIIAAICVLAAACIGIGAYIAVDNHNQQVAAQEEQARIEAEQQAAAEQEAQRQKEEQEAKEKLSSYTVRYLVKGSKKKLKDELSKSSVTIGTTVKITAPTFKNYTLKGDKTVKLTIAKDPSANVVTFYYTKKKAAKTPDSSYNNGGTNSGTDSGSASGGSSGGSGSGGTSGGSTSGGSKGGSGDKPIIDIDL